MNILPKRLIKVVASASLLASTLLASNHSLASQPLPNQPQPNQPLPFEAVYQANYSGLKVTANWCRKSTNTTAQAWVKIAMQY
jgi:hypothetical protein